MNTRSLLFMLILIILFFYSSVCFPGGHSGEIIYEKHSLYQYIAVVESAAKTERYILAKNKGFKQGGIFIDAPDKLLLDYTKTALVGLAFLQRSPRQVLFVGLGAGAMPRYFRRHFPDSQADIVELDPEILAVAEKYFHFRQDENMHVHMADGRAFLKKNSRKYDMIFLDAYQNNSIPFHLTTLEFLREVRGQLKEDGVVVSNISVQPRTRLFDALLRTYTEAFSNISVFIAKEGGNFIFIATADGQGTGYAQVMDRARILDLSKNWDLTLSHIASRRLNWTGDRARRGRLLTDDFAPVNIYMYQEQKVEK